MTEFQDTLKSSLNHYGQGLKDETIAKIEQHYQLMLKWNKTHNLTRIVSLEDAISKHYLDCILGLNFVSENKPIYDLGSGAGFPGIIGGILRPQQDIYLVEPARKRATFLKQVKSVLGLNNIHIVNERAETINNVDIVISRGTFSWPTTAPLLEPLKENGHLYLWVGQNPSEKVFSAAMRTQGHIPCWGSYDLGSAGQRHMGMAIKGPVS